MSLETLTELIKNYGYLAILIGTFLEGETILLLGGFAAHMGYLQLPWVILSALTGSFCGDQIYFYIGRYFGPKIIAKRLSWQEGAERVYGILKRHQNLLILTFRFFYGLRNVTPFAVGAARVSRVRFLTLNFIGAVIWSIAFACIGFIFGEAIERYLEDFHRYEIYILLGMVVLGLLVWLITTVRQRRRALQQHQESP
jgi:membrane protein DedA with SNARE-associated domain